MPEPATSVQYVKGIGPRLAEVLAAKGIHTVDDLLHYLPFRYEDRLNPRGIAELRAGEMATVIAEVRNSGLFRTRRMPIFQMTAGQGRARLKCIWFNATYLRDRFKPGQMVALYGKVEQDHYGGELQLVQPQFEILGDADDASSDAAAQKAAASLEIGRIVPIYESAGQGRLSTRWFRRIIHTALENLPPELPDPIPAAVRQHLSLISPREALWKVHWPDPGESLQDLQSSRTPAHIRLIFEELFFVELGLELKRRQQKAQTGIAFRLDEGVRAAIKKILPFHPTGAQKRALKEIASDMAQPSPMRRLLQGDVGSGKTLVAFEAAIIAIENGYQVALMAPTEILAQQHYFSARRILEHAGYRVVLLTGSLEDSHKRDIRRHIAQGDAQLVIGTHALIEQKVEFAKLGLVIVDEQHRFGVLQRFKLMKKTGEPGNSHVGTRRLQPALPRRAKLGSSPEPDVLVMTATPIPRTLALTLYGDLDVSVLDEMPPGRVPIVTRCVSDDRSRGSLGFRAQASRRRTSGLRGLSGHRGKRRDRTESRHQNVQGAEQEDLPRPARRPVARPHGVRPERPGHAPVPERRAGHPGVDHGDRGRRGRGQRDRDGHRARRALRLAQLHQLRGRIGRGAAKSYCVLMTGGKVSEDGERRLDAMVRTTDGFQIAELDLELRGPGEFFGTRQAGLPSFQVANLIRDRQLLEAAKLEAAAVLAGPNAEISQEEIDRALRHMRTRWQGTYGLVEVG